MSTKSKFPTNYITKASEKIYEVLGDKRPNSDWTQIGLSIQQALQAAANYVQRVNNEDERIDCLYKILYEMSLMETRNISDNSICIYVTPKPKWDQILYCPLCGSVEIVERCLQNVNTGEFDDITSEYYCKGCHENIEEPVTLKELWDLFGDVAVDEDDCIEESFLEFEAGDSKYDVWRWFNKRSPNGLKDLGVDLPPEIIKEL